MFEIFVSAPFKKRIKALDGDDYDMYFCTILSLEGTGLKELGKITLCEPRCVIVDFKDKNMPAIEFPSLRKALMNLNSLFLKKSTGKEENLNV